MKAGFPFAFLLYSLNVHNFLYHRHHHHPFFDPNQLAVHCSIEMRMYESETYMTFSKSIRFFYALAVYVMKIHKKISAEAFKYPKISESINF